MYIIFFKFFGSALGSALNGRRADSALFGSPCFPIARHNCVLILFTIKQIRQKTSVKKYKMTTLLRLRLFTQGRRCFSQIQNKTSIINKIKWNYCKTQVRNYIFNFTSKLPIKIHFFRLIPSRSHN